MHLKTTSSGVRTAIRSAAALLAISLGACEPESPVAPMPQAATPQSAQVPSDPVLAYVSMGPIGKTAVISDPAEGGDVVVVINTQYNAASGNVCRTYAVTSASIQSQHLACSDGADWQEIAPLVASNN